MSRTLNRFSIPLIGSAIAAFGLFACSSDKSSTTTVPDGGGNTTSAGGATGSSGGGTAAGGKATGSGGTATGAGGKASGAGGAPLTDPYTCEAKPSTDPGGTGMSGDACCTTAGAGDLGTCATTKPGDAAAGLGHDSCGPTLTCNFNATKLGALSPDAGAFGHCSSDLGVTGGTAYEGRCIPKCFLAGSPTAATLKQETCRKDFICTPCFNPTDAKPTGACSTAPGDMPANPAPTAYAKCGGLGDAGTDPLGLCVPKVLADASGNASAAALKQDDCASPTDRCVPAVTAANPAACFPKCSSVVGGLGAQYKEGACIPTFVVRDTSPSAVASLMQDDCAGKDEKCVPCRDPNNMDKPTHACE